MTRPLTSRHLILVALASILCHLGAPTRVAAQPSGADSSSEVQGSENLFQWMAPSIARQLDAEMTRIPEGMGAIFVPVLSDARDEPEVRILGDEAREIAGPVGERVIVAPGYYQVRVGSGTASQATVVPNIQVVAGETAVVPIGWGALRVVVVDDANIPQRADYELIRLTDREVIGIGYGADTLQGERLETWVLRPGVYRIVQPGANYRTRTNFSTVYVPEAGLVNFKLVVDAVTGDFLGAGILAPSELGFEEGSSQWTQSLILGVNAGLAHSDGFVGLPDQISLSGDLFLDAYATFDDSENYFNALLEWEEGLLWVDPANGDALPLQKSRDRIRLEALYTYFFNPYVGPYARAGAIASLFPSQVVVTEPTTVRRIFVDGTTADETVPGGEAFDVGGYLSTVAIRQGVGLNTRLLRNEVVSLNLRLGIGLRQNLFNDAFVATDDTTTPELEFSEVDDFNQEGVESTITGRARLTGYISYLTDFEFFSDFQEFDQPTIDWRNTVSFRISSFASLDYTLQLLQAPQISNDLQLNQNVLLRLSFELL